MGCAVVASLFGVLLPLLYAIGGTWEGGEMGFVPAFIGVPAFLGGNILAIAALFSRDPASRRSAKRALLLLWGSVLLAVLVGFTLEVFRQAPVRSTPR